MTGIINTIILELLPLLENSYQDIQDAPGNIGPPSTIKGQSLVSWARSILPLVAIGLLVGLFFFRLAFTDLILARGDTFAYFYPYWDVRDAALRVGELPLWTSDLFMGAPLLANPQLGTLYPPNWLTVGLDAPDSIRVSILIHVGWAAIGAFFLARRSFNVNRVAALGSGVIFAFGGFLGSHVEQINQLQSLAWMPWLFLLLHLSFARWRYVLLMGIAWALQILAGHTQIVFVTGIGLAIYSLMASWQSESSPTRLFKPGLILSLAAAVAIILALPQLIPTQELISLSNRGDGLNQQEVTAFSLNPFLIGRGLLPSYDSQPFGEYVGYIGIVGLGLAIVGATAPDKQRWVWIVLVLIGLLFALGRHTLIYWTLAGWPGFNLFRVPARWLALATLALAMLAALGLNHIRDIWQVNRAQIVSLIAMIALLTGLSLLSDHAANEVDGPAMPTHITFIAWVMATITFTGVLLSKQLLPFLRQHVDRVLFVMVVIELWLASLYLPYNDASDPRVYKEPRFTADLLHVLGKEDMPPGRLLTISNLLFDPGDKSTLEARWDRMGLSDRAARYAFTATKMQETLSANVPLTWDIPSVDGFGGGVLPTLYYTQFTSLLLPDGAMRSVDGRLREVLAQPVCRGACLPDDRWLDLMNVRYLLTDKVHDLWHDDIAYDTQFNLQMAPSKTVEYDNLQAFEADGVNILYQCVETSCQPPDIMFALDNVTIELTHTSDSEMVVIDGSTLAEYAVSRATVADSTRIRVNEAIVVNAVTIVDNRTGDFMQLTPPGWEQLYSADIKIYENLDVLPRAFVVHDTLVVPDSYAGTEQALETLDDPHFDPAQTAVIHTNDNLMDIPHSSNPISSARIVRYSDTNIEIEVHAVADGYLILTDAFYPGWKAQIGKTDVPIYRANTMFRAIPVSGGVSTVQLTFSESGAVLAEFLFSLFF